MTEAERRVALEQVAEEVRDCTRCRLHEGRSTIVFGQGSAEARLMFIGEGPGEEEDRQGLPFVGRAGQLLNKMIAAMGLRREEVYIGNVVKCRPPQNRSPLEDEAATCSPYLFQQIEIIQPEVIVSLGVPAARTLLRHRGSMGEIRGKWHKYLGRIPVMPTYHPSYLLRSYTPENRKTVWRDLQEVLVATPSSTASTTSRSNSKPSLSWQMFRVWTIPKWQAPSACRWARSRAASHGRA